MDRKKAIEINRKRHEEERKIFDEMFNEPINVPLRKIRIYKEDCKNDAQNDEIIENKTYLIVTNGKAYLGVASKAWFGWQFMTDGYWKQLNHVDMVFDIELPEFPSKPLGRVEVPPEEDYEDEEDYGGEE